MARVVSSQQDRRAMAPLPPEILAALWQRLAEAQPLPVPAAALVQEARAGSNSEEFMMYEFKVRRCPHARAHEWTACPYAHPGEAARRRDPRRFGYSGDPCPNFRLRRPGGAACPRGAGCPFAHGTFETWLHPSRYRTRPCRAGIRCARPVCFFAHTDTELRFVSDDAVTTLSPKSMLAAWESRPSSPVEGKVLPPMEQDRTKSEIESLALAVQEINLRIAQEINLRKAIQTWKADTVLPQVTEEDGPELGWVSDMLA